MTNKRTTKQQLVASIVLLFMCFSMLLGTTFAWFTDSATSAGNKIVAGTLDVDLLMWDGDSYEDIGDSNAPIFGKGSLAQNNNAETLWEPGKTQVVYLKIANNGTLDLKYQVAINVRDNADDKDLYKVLEYAIDTTAQNGKDADPWTDGKAVKVGNNIDNENDTFLAAKGEHFFALLVHMNEDAGNEYQGGYVEFDIKVLATQVASEKDSFNNQYDVDATYPEVDTIVLPETSTAPVDIVDYDEDEKRADTTITLPAGSAAGTYKLAVSNENVVTDAEGNTVASFDIELTRNGEKVPVGAYVVERYVGEYLNDVKVTHKGEPVAIDDYDPATGYVTFTVDSFSPFAVSYYRGIIDSVDDLVNISKGGSFILGADIALDEAIAISEDVVLNLNGKTISNETGYIIENKGNLIITGNGTMSGLGCIRSTAGSITIENGNFYAASRWQDGVYQHTLKAVNTNVVINGGNFDATVGGHTNAVLNASENGVITINGGSFKNVDGALATFDPYIFTYEKNGKVVINDGTFYGGWRFNGETATTDIYGGKFTVGFDGQSFHASSTHTVTVYGGVFAADSKLAGKLADIVADGYTAVENADGTYTVLKGSVVAGDNATLNEALKDGEKDIALGQGNFTMPGTSGDVTISGTLDTVITVTTPTANNVTLNGVTVVAGSYKGIQHSDTVVFENCVIKGTQFLYANKVIFKNCTIDLTEAADYIWTYSAKNVEFIDCVFNTKGKAILIYNEGPDLVTNVTVKGCTFNATESALASGAVAAAIEIDSHYATNGHYTLTTENNIVDPDFSAEWRVKNSAKNNTTVNGVVYNKVEDGLYKGTDNTFYVYNANGLEKLNAMMADKTAGRDTVVNLMADIDFTGKTWTPVDSHADSAFEIAEINGNGHTIKNLTINGQAMFRRFAGTGDVVIKDITFDGATVNSNGSINTSILTVQTYQNTLLDNVDVKNSTITGGYKVAPLIATVYNENASTITATLKDCDVSDTVVTATYYDFCTTGMVAFVNAGNEDKIEFENCTVTNVEIYAPNSYTAHAWVYTTGSGTLFNEVEGVTVSGCTFENK